MLIWFALKTMSNYLDHISPTKLDPAFSRKPQASTDVNHYSKHSSRKDIERLSSHYLSS